LKVQLIRNKLEDDNSKTGVGNYADILEDLLKDEGIEAETIPFELTFEKGIRNAIKEGMTVPLRKILLGRKGTDIVHVTFEYCSILLPFARAKKVVTVHHIVGRDEKNSRKWFLMWRLAAWISIVSADRIIAISTQTKEEILRKYRIDPNRIETLGFFTKDFGPLGGVEKERLIGCMGTLNERKNFTAAINVFGSILEDGRYEDHRMIICGKGPLRDRLREHAESLGIGDRVEFIQEISKEELVRFYNRCSLILNTSSHEGLGLATVEAQMCGTPVLYFRDANIPREITKAAVQCSDERDMSEKAKEILGDDALMKRLIDDGLEHTSYLRRDFKERILGVYASLCEK